MRKMAECDERPVRIGEINTTQKERKTLKGILDMIDRGQIRDDHPLQRNPDMWSRIMTDGYIGSVVKGEDMDAIKLVEETVNGKYGIWIIDGLQRITTARNFKLNAFALGNNIERPIIEYRQLQRDENGNVMVDEFGDRIFEYVTFDLRGKRYKDFPEEVKAAFNEYNFDVVCQLKCTTKDAGYHIRRYNRKSNFNTSQNAVTYMDEVAGSLKVLSSHTFIRDNTALSPTQRNNGGAEKFVLECLMAVNFLDEWKKSPKDQAKFLTERCNKNNFDDMSRLFDRLNEIVNDDTAKLFTQKSGFLFIKLFHEFTKFGMEDVRFKEFLISFQGTMGDLLVGENTWAELEKDKSTKDRGIIDKKLYVLEKLMIRFFRDTTEDAKEKSDLETLEFIQDNVNKDVIMVDIEDYMADLASYVGQFKGSNLLKAENKNSLLAIVAYTYVIDFDPTEWFTTYFNAHDVYISDQKENYLYMKNNLDQFKKEKEETEYEFNEAG